MGDNTSGGRPGGFSPGGAGSPFGDPNSQSLMSIPCYYDALSIGIATGALAGVHRYRQVRHLVSAIDRGVKACCGFSLATFGVCRYQFHQQRDKLTEAIHTMAESRRNKEKLDSVTPKGDNKGQN